MTHDTDRAAEAPRVDSVDLGLEGLQVSPGDHVVHFYEEPRAARRVRTAYLSAGLDAGDRCVHVLGADESRDGLLDDLRREGVDVEEALSAEQLLLDEGGDRPAELRETLRRVTSDVPETFPFLRWSGEMTWTIERFSDSRALMEWETACNVTDHERVTFLCQYALSEFSGRVVLDALQTHPVCIVGSSVQRNSLYVDPERYLERLQENEPTVSARD